jgi:hypothetical protein
MNSKEPTPEQLKEWEDEAHRRYPFTSMDHGFNNVQKIKRSAYIEGRKQSFAELTARLAELEQGNRDERLLIAEPENKAYHGIQRLKGEAVTDQDLELYAELRRIEIMAFPTYFPAQPSQGNRWISVEERLPEDRTRVVLAYHSTYSAVRENQFRDGVWKNDVNGINTDVTHWMELPAPPITDKKENV